MDANKHLAPFQGGTLMKTKDIRKEKPKKLATTQFKSGKTTFYVFYNEKSAKVKTIKDNAFILIGTYKKTGQNWIHEKRQTVPEDIKAEVERLFP